MATYNKEQVLNIIESQAKASNIPVDDFLRFSYIETGGKFDPTVSRGPNSAKGLFQFVPSTARQYGIEGQELDATANTRAAAQLYLDNKRSIVNTHNRTGNPCLSGKSEPDGLDMYMAHQQGARGYQSIQDAIATGSFTHPNTKANILNNVGRSDLQTITGHSYTELSQMSDKDMATTFVNYWQNKFDRIRIPEKGIEPVTHNQQQTTSQTQPTQAKIQGGEIELTKAHALTLQYDHVQYGFGSKNVSTGNVDCSGWVVEMQNATMKEINQKAGKEIFSKKDLFSPGNDAAATIIQKSVNRSSMLIEGKQVTKDILREGMIIGEDNGNKGWDKGRYKGIDHITMVVRDPKTNALIISESSSKKGVHLTPVDQYLKYKQNKGTKLFVTDPLSKSRELLKDKQPQINPSAPQKTETEQSRDNTSNIYRQGSKGEGVITLQKQLNQLGIKDANGNKLSEDKNFGANTKAAVQNFQRQNGLKPDGIVGPATQGKINEALKNLDRKPEPNAIETMFNKLTAAAKSGKEFMSNAAESVSNSAFGKQIQGNAQQIRQEAQTAKEVENQQQVQVAQVYHKSLAR